MATTVRSQARAVPSAVSIRLMPKPAVPPTGFTMIGLLTRLANCLSSSGSRISMYCVSSSPASESVAPPKDVAAIVCELIQGEGGNLPAPTPFLQQLHQRADRSGALLVFDEVQPGFGRTGAMFAAQHYGARPDVMAIAKAIASGLPLGAVAAAAARATLRVHSRVELDGRARETGARARRHLAERQPGISEVRGPGLMIGVEFDARTKEDGKFVERVLERCLALGLVATPQGPTAVSRASSRRSTSASGVSAKRMRRARTIGSPRLCAFQSWPALPQRGSGCAQTTSPQDSRLSAASRSESTISTPSPHSRAFLTLATVNPAAETASAG